MKTPLYRQAPPNHLWQNDKLDKLTVEERLLYNYYFTCPHMNLMGYYKLSPGYILSDIPQFKTLEQINSMASKLEELELIKTNTEHKTILLCQYILHCPFQNPKVIKNASQKLIYSVPPTELDELFISDIETLKKQKEKENEEGNANYIQGLSELIEAVRSRV